MKRTILTVTLGVAVGLAVHFAYFRLHEPAAIDTLDGQLAWMKSELKLTDQQFARIKEVHQASGPKLRAISAQLAQMQAEFQDFEKARRANDRVDFLEFARFVEARRAVRRASLDSTRQLVMAAAEVMNPEQRQRYLQLVETVEPLDPLASN
ncbi:MAG TPA: Spy/CpxP family protein refolding chaperone [Lacunisphaera sp.]|nr:Spy/CpxP family protein refolding chaperone [Lacunisphaera sp.]